MKLSRWQFPGLLAVCLLNGGCVSATTDQNARGSKVEPRIYEASIDEVYVATRSALESLEWKVKSEDQATYTIQANVPMSMWTWGDKLTVVHTLEESGGGSVNGQAKTGLQIVDYGKNKRNIRALYAAIDAALD